ncbi:HAD-IA family hydrolase [Nocardia tengchongensis]|uniref:HAD-IA family hydrolase n=1 Tax=Nocardia tengchongensis TaxID=2055889 RepID=A0ABX8CMI2_9NOCA|nr:HAD-IA family hydrolase [Nocardia tengchongensis]QVI20153.1 HAD-IA family hydrolase [Nocardia tengchongensis]
MAIDAVLFDFSGTLFRFDDAAFNDACLTDANGRLLDTHEIAEIMRRMTAPVGQFVEFDAEGQYAWENRDLDPALHRRAYLDVLEQSGVPADQAARLYGLMRDASEWTPYPDTGGVLRALHESGVRVGVVSNIAFDIRPAFADRGWHRYIGEFALSYEVGAMKPDTRLFEAALDGLGVTPDRALMVGDSLEADGGAKALGCTFALVDPLPTEDRATALWDAVRAHGLLTP